MKTAKWFCTIDLIGLVICQLYSAFWFLDSSGVISVLSNASGGLTMFFGLLIIVISVCSYICLNETVSKKTEITFSLGWLPPVVCYVTTFLALDLPLSKLKILSVCAAILLIAFAVIASIFMIRDIRKA